MLAGPAPAPAHMASRGFRHSTVRSCHVPLRALLHGRLSCAHVTPSSLACPSILPHSSEHSSHSQSSPQTRHCVSQQQRHRTSPHVHRLCAHPHPQPSPPCFTLPPLWTCHQHCQRPLSTRDLWQGLPPFIPSCCFFILRIALPSFNATVANASTRARKIVFQSQQCNLRVQAYVFQDCATPIRCPREHSLCHPFPSPHFYSHFFSQYHVAATRCWLLHHAGSTPVWVAGSIPCKQNKHTFTEEQQQSWRRHSACQQRPAGGQLQLQMLH